MLNAQMQSVLMKAILAIRVKLRYAYLLEAVNVANVHSLCYNHVARIETG